MTSLVVSGQIFLALRHLLTAEGSVDWDFDLGQGLLAVEPGVFPHFFSALDHAARWRIWRVALPTEAADRLRCRKAATVVVQDLES